MRLTHSDDGLGGWCVQKSDELLFDDVGQKETGHDFLGVGDGLVHLGSCRRLQNVIRISTIEVSQLVKLKPVSKNQIKVGQSSLN